jgi:hypothetical protein
MKKLYASIWYNAPLEKWKLNEAIVVENGKITNWACGGTFHFGPEDEDGEVLKEALIDLMFFDPEEYGDYDDPKWQKDLEKLMKETEIEFVASEEIEKLRKKCPEA